MNIQDTQKATQEAPEMEEYSILRDEDVWRLGQGVVYLYRRRGLTCFTACGEAQYNELAKKPNLFDVKILYTEQQPCARCAELAVLLQSQSEQEARLGGLLDLNAKIAALEAENARMKENERTNDILLEHQGDKLAHYADTIAQQAEQLAEAEKAIYSLAGMQPADDYIAAHKEKP